MKKVLIFAAIVIFLFGAFAYVSNYSTSKDIEGNPYGKDSLHPLTIKQLQDPNYKNQILPAELSSKLEKNEDVFVYFYKPDCQYCQATSPTIVPLAQELNVDLKLLNLVEFPEGWETFNIQSVPTIIHYKKGEEVAPRLMGAVPAGAEDRFTSWIEEVRR